MTTETSQSIGSPGTDRASSLATRTAAKGHLAWARDTGAAASADWPPTLLAWGPRIVVATYGGVTVFDRDGHRLWTHAKQGGTPVAVNGERLLLKGTHRFIEALDPSGRVVVEQAPFPGAMGRETQVRLFWARSDDFVAVLFRPAPEEVAEGDSPDRPETPARTTLLKNHYPSSLGDWIEIVQGDAALAPLLQPERHRVTLAVGEALRYDFAEEKLVGRFPLPLDEPVDWSVDADENYCVVGYADGHKTVVLLAADGSPRWRWSDPEADLWVQPQPPIRLPGGRIAVLTASRVIAIDQGRLAWQFDARGESLRHGARLASGSFEVKDGVLLGKGALHRGIALADGSLLVTNGPTLIHLGPDGHKRFSLTLDAEILGAPLVDVDGHVYVATAAQLVRID